MSETTFRMNDTPGSAGLHGPSCPSFPAATPLTCTVPKEFVHRAAVAEVLLTGWRRVDATHFTVTAQWPRLHGFYSAVQGRHDPCSRPKPFARRAPCCRTPSSVCLSGISSSCGTCRSPWTRGTSR